jgi:hypothetical protein
MVLLVCTGLYVAGVVVLLRTSNGIQWLVLTPGSLALVASVVILHARVGRSQWYSNRRTFAIVVATCVVLCVITIFPFIVSVNGGREGELLTGAALLVIAPVMIIVGSSLLWRPEKRAVTADAAAGSRDEDMLVNAWQSVRERQEQSGMRLWWVESASEAGGSTRLVCSDPRHELTQTVVVPSAPVEALSWIVVDEVHGGVVETASNAERQAWIRRRLRA